MYLISTCSIVILYSNKLVARCIEHMIHLMACHFVTALNVAGIRRTKKNLHQQANELNNEANKPFDIDTSMEIEPSSNNTEAIHMASNTNFDPGDIVGKLLAF